MSSYRAAHRASHCPAQSSISLFNPSLKALGLHGCVLLISLSIGQSALCQWTTTGNNIYNSNTANVGIGTTTPAAKLDVNYSGTGSDIFAQFHSPNSGGANVLELKENNYIGMWRVYCSNSARGFWWFGNTGTTDYGAFNISTLSNFTFSSGSRAMMDIGGYSVGNSSSSGSIVYNSLSIDPTINTLVGTTKIRGIYYNPTLTNTGGTFTHIAYENTTGLNILNSTSGNTLIGTSTDNGNKLQVNGTISTTGLLLTTGAAAGKVLTSDASGNATWQTATGGSSGWALAGNSAINPTTTFIGTTDASVVALRTNNMERLRVDASGNVGIGTTAPQSLLAVKGTITSQKVVVTQIGWADYVFDPDYQLRPLKEVGRFIDENHHLPDMPTADQVAKEGDDLGANQTALLKKVEELTLYLIKQDQRLEVQDRILKVQEEQISKLEKLLAAKIQK